MKYCYIAEEYKDAIVSLELNQPNRWVEYSVRHLGGTRTASVYRLEPPAPLPCCYAKIYCYPEKRDRRRIFFRGGFIGTSRAGVELANLRHLNKQGLAPRVIACGHQRVWGMLSASLLVTEEVRGAVTMDRFVAGSLAGLTIPERRHFLCRLAEFTRTMNTGRYVNGQYHWRNILVCRRDNEITFQVIDPSSSRWWYRLVCPLYDLATLDVCAPHFFTRSERLRFFKRHQHTTGRPLTARQKKQLRKIALLRDEIAKKEMVRYHFILPSR